MLSQYTESPKNPAYIASQGPLQNCAGDFWQMVWEQGVSEVIMLSLNDGIDVSMIFYSSARFSQSYAYLELIGNSLIAGMVEPIQELELLLLKLIGQ